MIFLLFAVVAMQLGLAALNVYVGATTGGWFNYLAAAVILVLAGMTLNNVMSILRRDPW